MNLESKSNVQTEKSNRKMNKNPKFVDYYYFKEGSFVPITDDLEFNTYQIKSLRLYQIR
ncbi:hypothetical protein J4456_00485 [Candidatus Pacearchaeota archaeon]|nr:hypothetical protein [Candidatus Pacearchaeota archaeon]